MERTTAIVERKRVDVPVPAEHRAARAIVADDRVAPPLEHEAPVRRRRSDRRRGRIAAGRGRRPDDPALVGVPEANGENCIAIVRELLVLDEVREGGRDPFEEPRAHDLEGHGSASEREPKA